MNEQNGNLPDEQLVARLVQAAGRRRPVSKPRTARVRAAARAEWERAVADRRRSSRTKRLSWSLAAAASLVAFLGVAAWQLGVGPWAPVAPVAGVERTAGISRLYATASATDYVEARRGEDLAPGSVVETTERSLVALRLASGHSVRLDRGSRLQIRSGSEMYLERGAVYVDSGMSGDGLDAVEILTPFGTAREIGTQFEVRLDGDSMRLRVREGTVDLEHAGGADRAYAGTELTLDSAGSMIRRAVSQHGPDWEWSSRIAPAFVLQGASLESFMAWISRETGLQVLYMDASIAEAALKIELKGSIESLSPYQALDAVLPTCSLDHRIEEGTIIISRQEADGGNRP
jgi:ferric-dicitrate binding protein FerR (iron transport regulator)